MMVLVAVLIVVLGMADLTMDAGKLLLTSCTLQATAGDAALAGAITLPASAGLTGVTAITQGMVNADNTVSISLYDVTNSPTSVESNFSTTGDCSNGTGGAGGYCNTALSFSDSALSASHTYRLQRTKNREHTTPV